MRKTDWRDRLRQAVDDSGKAMREISLGAGCGPGYLFDILRDNGKNPTLPKLLSIIGQMDASLLYVVYGFEIGADEERLLEVYAKMDPIQRDAFLKMAASISGISPEK